MSDRAQAERLAAERADARAAKDFARADALREEIVALGFDVADGPGGPALTERAPFVAHDPSRVPEEAATLTATIHLLYEGFRDDVTRFLAGLPRADGLEVLVTEAASPDAAWVESLADGAAVRALHLDRETGFAEARNAAARASRGRVLVFADLSVEPRGDVVGPLVAALRDPAVGVCGPWGLATTDLREFAETPGPDAHAIEGYLLAVRRDDFVRAGGFDPWFRWYRHADLDLSYRVRALGLGARVVPVPAERHEHRGWTGVPEPERAARSKRNFYRFLDRWKESDLARTE